MSILGIELNRQRPEGLPLSQLQEEAAMEDEDLESHILKCCNDLLLCPSSSLAVRQLQALSQSSGARASPVLLRFLRQPHLPDSALDVLAQCIAQCCGACSAPASSVTFTFSPSLSVQVKEMDYVNGGLGWKVWGSALLLSWKLVEMQKSFQGKQILELGSGCGLCGLLVAKLGAAEVTLSDSDPDIILNLCYNAFHLCAEDSSARLSVPYDTGSPSSIYKISCYDFTYKGGAKESATDAFSCRVRVRLLDWLDDPSEFPSKFVKEVNEDGTFHPLLDVNDKFDWVIGSDLIYNHHALQSLAGVIQRRLSSVNGRALFAVPVREDKELGLFLKELDHVGMDTQVEHCNEHQWNKCMAAMGAVQEGGTLHGIDHYEGGLIIISVTHKVKC